MPLIHCPSLDRWIEHVFDHPESDPTWHHRPDSDYWSGEKSLKAERIAETFEQADKLLARFSDKQIETGLWMVIGEDYTSEAFGEEVPLEFRLRLVRSTYHLYSKLFAVRCGKVDWGGRLPLYCICYMFWEIFPLENRPEQPQNAPVWEEKISALERILELDNPMCQYAALHGLGHAQRSVPEKVAEIIDRWSARRTEADARLREYAQDARKGDVQ